MRPCLSMPSLRALFRTSSCLEKLLFFGGCRRDFASIADKLEIVHVAGGGRCGAVMSSLALWHRILQSSCRPRCVRRRPQFVVAGPSRDETKSQGKHMKGRRSTGTPGGIARSLLSGRPIQRVARTQSRPLYASPLLSSGALRQCRPLSGGLV